MIECWWEILHGGHHAWYQRALLRGDFRPGLIPCAHYIVDKEGRAADPTTTPTCETCGEVPDVNDLEAVERATGKAGFLESCRSGKRPWPEPTNPLTCWWCNIASTADPVKVAAAAQAKRQSSRAQAAAQMPEQAAQRVASVSQYPQEDIFVCPQCKGHLTGEN